ncbi:MAG: class I SAM-dependent methyltransferase [Burkholderiaceae bacterium]
MPPTTAAKDIIDNELDLLASLVSLDGKQVIELGCGAAKLARELLQRHPASTVTGVEVDSRQHAKNLATPQQGLVFLSGVAQAIPVGDAGHDLALMLKSLHHVPVTAMVSALAEVARVLRPGGQLYVSEPIFDGALNEVTRLYNDEQVVRAAAQAALDCAIANGSWTEVAVRRFVVPVHFADFAEFEKRMVQQTYADHRLSADTLARVRQTFESNLGAKGADFLQPMHVRLLRPVN